MRPLWSIGEPDRDLGNAPTPENPRQSARKNNMAYGKVTGQKIMPDTVGFNHVQHISFTQFLLTDVANVILDGLLLYKCPSK